MGRGAVVCLHTCVCRSGRVVFKQVPAEGNQVHCQVRVGGGWRYYVVVSKYSIVLLMLIKNEAEA